MKYLIACNGSIDDIKKVSVGTGFNRQHDILICTGELEAIEYIEPNNSNSNSNNGVEAILSAELITVLFASTILLFSLAWIFRQLQAFIK